MDESTEHIVYNSGYQLRCIDDPSALKIKGDFNSNSASNLMVVFEFCDSKNPERTGAEKCKSEEQILKAIDGAYLLLIENVERYKH